MPRPKPIKKVKTPTPIVIQEGGLASSPHVLNLRPPKFEEQQINLGDLSPLKNRAPSFEQRVAAFDERLNDLPNLLKARSDSFATLLKQERENWEDGFGRTLRRAAAFGARLKKQLGRPGRGARVRGRAFTSAHALLRLPRSRRLRPANARGSELGFFILILCAITIPWQGLLLYRAIETAKQSTLAQLAGAQAKGSAFIEALAARSLEQAHEELIASIAHLEKIHKTVAALGPLQRLLPQRINLGIATVKLGELAARGAERILSAVLQAQQGNVTPAQSIAVARAEIANFSAVLRSRGAQRKDAPWLRSAADRLRALEDFLAVAAYLAPVQEQRNLLLVFQNPRELRATGGFMGSIAALRVKNGEIDAIEVPEGGSYDRQGQLTLQRLSPAPLHLINSRFELQDANWWPSFPDSARKIAQLYEAAGGPTLDGVVAVTANVGEELLRQTGPVRAASAEETELNAHNFIDALQETISRDREQNRRAPKKIIAALLPTFLERGGELGRSNPAKLATVLLQSLHRKDIQLWSRDEETQAAIRRLGFAGELKAVDGDYLAVITSNVAGGKTDGVVEENIEHRSQVMGDGKVRSEVSITRSHQGAHGNRLSGERNTAYLRIYVPKGAKLISAEGFNPPPPYLFEEPLPTLTPDPEVRAQEAALERDPPSGTEVWAEADKTVFGNWIVVDAGETVTGRLRYEFPLRAEGRLLSYNLIIDRQAGKRAKFESAVTFTDGLALLVGEGAGAWHPSGWNFSGVLEEAFSASGMLYRL